MTKKYHPTWIETEKAIFKEMAWLKNSLLPYQSDLNPLNYSDDCFYRLIAVLIVAGKIRAKEYDLISDEINIEKLSDNKKHGASWHNNMIQFLSRVFMNGGYQVDCNEPRLYYGHADLKTQKDDKIVYFEIDTVNIFKLWINLIKMPRDERIISITANKIIIFEC